MPKIMIVEDERVVAFDLAQQLEAMGYEICASAFSGPEALRQAAQTQPDLILMDIRIQGDMSGIDTAAKLRTIHPVPVIYLTAHSDDATLQSARETQPYGYLVKPFSDRELHASIQMALERRKADEAVRRSEEQLRLALDAAEMGIWELDAATDRLHRAGRTDQILGLATEAFDGSFSSFMQRVYPQDRREIADALEQARVSRTLLRLEFRSLRADGSVAWLRVQAKSFDGGGSAKERIVGVVQDVTERRRSEEQLRQAATVFEVANEGIFILDREHRIVTINEAYSAITGYSVDEALGRLPDVTAISNDVDASADIWSELDRERSWQGEVSGQRKNGQRYPAWLGLSAVKDPRGDVAHYVGVLSDVTALREAEDRLRHLAHHDALTDLPNRLLIMDRLEHALTRARRHREFAAVIFIDLDHFKQVNDTLGHNVGDEFLRGVAQRLQGTLRREDSVGRLGGDEFVIVVDGIQRIEDVDTVAKKILASLNQPIVAAGHPLTPSASIGVAVFPNDGETREGLVGAADRAMYAVKQAGGNRYLLNMASAAR